MFPGIVRGMETGARNDDDTFLPTQVQCVVGEGAVTVMVVPVRRAGEVLALMFRENGPSPNVYRALLLLADAIRVDNEERPQ